MTPNFAAVMYLFVSTPLNFGLYRKLIINKSQSVADVLVFDVMPTVSPSSLLVPVAQNHKWLS